MPLRKVLKLEPKNIYVRNVDLLYLTIKLI